MNIIDNLNQLLCQLPNLGHKSARRLIFHLLQKKDLAYVNQLAQGLLDLKKNIHHCPLCFSYTQDKAACHICASPSRNRDSICIIEEVSLIYTLETMKTYEGVYFVLHGLLNPMEGMGPQELRLSILKNRIENENIKELILALRPSIEGEATSYYIREMLKDSHVHINQLALGIPYGADIDYLNLKTIQQAFLHRHPVSPEL